MLENNMPSCKKNRTKQKIIWETLLKIAWRNVRRYGKRTALTIVAMTFGIGIYIGMDSIYKGMNKAGLENIINLTDSFIRISTDKYESERSSLPLDYGFQDIEKIEEFIKSNNGVEAVTVRTRFLGQLSDGRNSMPIIGTVIDPVGDPKVFTIPEYIEGKWFSDETSVSGESNSYQNEIILGKNLAEEFGIGAGERITLSARTKYDTHNADDFLIIGVVNSPEFSINTGGVFISFREGEEFLDLGGLTTELAVRMTKRINLKDSMKDSKIVAAAIEKSFPALFAQSFEDVGRQFLEISKIDSKATGIIIFTILLIAGVGIANTVLMSVYSRVREIGVLRAFGLRRKDISKLFLIEGSIIGTIGSIAGVILGIGIDIYLIFVGVSVEKMMSSIDLTGLYMGGTMYGEWNIEKIIIGAIFGFIVAVFASSFPAKKAAKMEVANALHFM